MAALASGNIRASRPHLLRRFHPQLRSRPERILMVEVFRCPRRSQAAAGFPVLCSTGRNIDHMFV